MAQNLSSIFEAKYPPPSNTSPDAFICLLEHEQHRAATKEAVSETALRYTFLGIFIVSGFCRGNEKEERTEREKPQPTKTFYEKNSVLGSRVYGLDTNKLSTSLPLSSDLILFQRLLCRRCTMQVHANDVLSIASIDLNYHCRTLPHLGLPCSLTDDQCFLLNLGRSPLCSVRSYQKAEIQHVTKVSNSYN